jgi:hypothetical protein
MRGEYTIKKKIDDLELKLDERKKQIKWSDEILASGLEPKDIAELLAAIKALEWVLGELDELKVGERSRGGD